MEALVEAVSTLHLLVQLHGREMCAPGGDEAGRQALRTAAAAMVMALQVGRCRWSWPLVLAAASGWEPQRGRHGAGTVLVERLLLSGALARARRPGTSGP
jgi:hypothetical protein